MGAPKRKLSDLSDEERLKAYSRLFRFENEDDINAKDFAKNRHGHAVGDVYTKTGTLQP